MQSTQTKNHGFALQSSISDIFIDFTELDSLEKDLGAGDSNPGPPYHCHRSTSSTQTSQPRGHSQNNGQPILIKTENTLSAVDTLAKFQAKTFPKCYLWTILGFLQSPLSWFRTGCKYLGFNETANFRIFFRDFFCDPIAKNNRG